MDFLPALPIAITPLVVFGLLLLLGAAGGYLAHRLKWLPSITGFMALGFLIGPGGLGLLGQDVMSDSKILIDIALALILYRLGLSLDLRAILRNPVALSASLVESIATFASVGCILYVFGMPPIVSAIIGAIAISSSPAVLLHVAHEVGARGVVTESTKTLVALNNCISFAAFSILLPLIHYSEGRAWIVMVLQPSYRLFGSILLGVILAHALHQLAARTADAAQYVLAIVIGAIMLAIGLADALKLSLLVTPLTMGMVVASIEHENSISRMDFGSAFELFFIVLFVYAGANIHWHELVEFAPLVFALVLARSASKVLGIVAMSPFQRMPVRAGFSSGLLLIPMAGLAIGLSQTTASLFPSHANTVAAIVLGSVALFETIGPPVAKLAFRICGEDSTARPEGTAGVPSATERAQRGSMLP